MSRGASVRLAIEGSIGEVTIDRPQALNALDPAALIALREALCACRDDPRVRVVILTGAGERAFCVGSDLKATADAPPDYIRGYRLDTLGLDKPLVAAINGHCLGGGLELCAAGGRPDRRVARHLRPARSARRQLPRRRRRAAAAACAAARDRDADGPHGRVDRRGAGARTRPGVRCRRRRATARCGVRDLASRIAACAPLSLAAIRRVAAASEGRPIDEVYALSWAAFDALATTEDRQEGRRAFAEKRAPRFTGR